ncbi:hypothetical protein ACFL3C_03050 [Patescibacteria group bacterium]
MLNYIEIVALVTGVVVIIVETVIIFLLVKHLKALDKHIEKNEQLMLKFEYNIQEHLEHLNEHSHEIELKLEKICGPDMENMHVHKPLETLKDSQKIEGNLRKSLNK